MVPRPSGRLENLLACIGKLSVCALILLCAQNISVARASELGLSHSCKQSIYCSDYYHYDWWEAGTANEDSTNGLFAVGYDDPCNEGTKAYKKTMFQNLPAECNYTGKPFQYHHWTLGVVQLMPIKYGESGERESGPVSRLTIGVFTGVKGTASQHEVTVAGLACKAWENCVTEWSSLQTSAPGGYENNHIAVDTGYFSGCLAELSCEPRRLWGFEGELES